MSIVGVSGYGYTQYQTASKSSFTGSAFVIDETKTDETKTGKEVAEAEKRRGDYCFF